MTRPTMSPEKKYRPYAEYFPVQLPDRTWPNRQITTPPTWCSVDLRDGNQALATPMNVDQKLELFNLLVEIGLEEIEIGFPSASQVEFDFTRTLIEHVGIPDPVTPQVLTQARDHLIERTFEAICGAKRVIVHLYNSTSELQRRLVFRKDRADIIDLAVKGVETIRKLASQTATVVLLEYSPESFTGTECDFALQICEAVIGVWEPTPSRKLILNLPATVEMSTANLYADRIEWFCRNISSRDSLIISLHTHNDRGTGVAATELGLLAGAERVEGTLFGNGERTGNVDLVTLALNMFSQGVDPHLNLRNLGKIRQIAERCTQLPVHARHPYAGDLVFTAFSGSHQDAISKGMHERKKRRGELWEVPYLPIDPKDVGRTYEGVVRINSQSGKGGAAYIIEPKLGCELPKDMHPEFGALTQELAETFGTEIPASTLWARFREEYLDRTSPYEYVDFRCWPAESRASRGEDHNRPSIEECLLTVRIDGQERKLSGCGNGPLDACAKALHSAKGCISFEIEGYHEHASSRGEDAEAVAFVLIDLPIGLRKYGVGTHRNITKAAIKALLSALNRSNGLAGDRAALA